MKNKKKYLIIVIFILYFSLVFQGSRTIFNEKEDKNNKNIIPYLSTSESPVIEWARRWGGNNYGDDIGNGVAVDSSDNIYLAGTKSSVETEKADMVLVKYNSSGGRLWNHTWGGSSGDFGEGVAVDSSDNVYLAGSTGSFGAGSSDLVLVKYDSSGVEQWSRTWGGSIDDLGWGVAVDSSDNVYLAGYTGSFGAGSVDMVLVKFDSSGVQQWNRTWGGSNGDIGRGVAVDSSDNVYLAGETASFGAGSSDMDLVKYDSSGVQQWNRTWGGSDGDIGMGVAVDSSDNVYLVGTTSSFEAQEADMGLVKYDSSGVQQWNTIYGRIGLDGGHGVAVDSLGKVYISGFTRPSWMPDYEMFLLKYDIVEEKKDLVIPGYNLLFLISVISIITVISLKKKYN